LATHLKSKRFWSGALRRSQAVFGGSPKRVIRLS
jgi:hypothetical protein